MSLLLQVKRMLWKDLLLETRRVPEFGAALVFAVSAASLIGFAANRFAPSGLTGTLIAGLGLVLVEVFLAVFTAIMGFVREADKGTLEGVRSSPVEPVVVFLAKLVFTLVLLETLVAVSTGAAIFFGGTALREAYMLFPLLASAGIYLASVSAFASALSVYIEARGVLLPTLILVLSAPLIQDVIILVEGGFYGSGSWMLAFSGLGFMIVASWLSRYILEV